MGRKGLGGGGGGGGNGILYEDNRDYQKAYDYFVKWHETCQEVRVTGGGGGGVRGGRGVAALVEGGGLRVVRY